MSRVFEDRPRRIPNDQSSSFDISSEPGRVAIAFTAQGGGSLIDPHRIGDVHDLRRRLPVLYWEELDRTVSERGAGDADHLNDLFAREQPDDRACRACSAAGEPREISVLVDDHNLAGRRFFEFHSLRVA